MEDPHSIRQIILKYLSETPKQQRYNIKHLCKELGISTEYYNKNKQYLYNLVSDYKTNYQNKQGLKGLNFHNWRGFIYAPKEFDRRLAVEGGWVATCARNRYLLFKNGLGRLEWHESGRVNMWVKKPVTDAKCLKLLACAFFENCLIYDIRVFHDWAKSMKMKGVHCAIDTGERLPYLKFDGFAKSNGATLLLGDRSHPTCAELIINYPDWAERNEAMVESAKRLIASVMSGFSEQSAKFVEQQKQFTDTLASLNGSLASKPFVRGLYE